ncbi:hypothetical protein L484_014351 [Morus notabilis]|uniref:Auxin-induced protein 6B n=1 Tax=Morus notabilis TaxID=981085 RepID=W9RKF1_9ROSA|nr:hypothetical protein L484_014351 [Morus notabilis]
MVRKWHKLVCCRSFVGDRGYFVIYSNDQRRFVLPLEHLQQNIFQELLKMSEQEFGLQSGGPITLPCDSVFMDSILSLIQRGKAKDLDRAIYANYRLY